MQSAPPSPPALFRGLSLLRRDPSGMAKLGILGLAVFSQAFIPFLGAIIVQGWGAMLVRRVIEGRDGELPPLDFDFERLKNLVVVGFKPFLASFLWSLPGALFAAFIIGGGYVGVVAVAVASDGEAALVAVVVFLLALAILLPFVAILQLPATVAGLRAELADDLSAGLQLGPVLGFLRQNFWALFKGFLAQAIVGAVLGPIALALCYVPLLFLAAALSLNWSVYVADVYRAHVARGGVPFEIRPLPFES